MGFHLHPLTIASFSIHLIRHDWESDSQDLTRGKAEDLRSGDEGDDDKL